MTTATSIMNATFPRAIFAAANIAMEIGDDRAAAWLARRLPKAMRPDGELLAMLPWPFSEVFGSLGEAPRVPAVEGRAWLDDAQEWAERSARALIAASRAGDGIIHQDFTLPRHFGNVLDWLHALPETDPRMLDKLPRVTWDQAVEHARAYHERLKRGRLRVAGDAGTVDPIPTVAGHRWLHLVTPAALDAETAAMGHCVGDGGYDDETWDIGKDGLPQRPTHPIVAATGIWSLRDREGRSVLTAQVWCSGRVRQIQRRFNEAPLPEDVAHVVILVDRLREAIPDLRDPDWIVRDERDGSRHYRYAMPDGIHLKGGIFRLNPCIWKRLPTHMRVDGDVDLWGSDQGILDLRTADVKDLPEGARITGDVLTKREEGEEDSIYTIGRGQAVFWPIRAQYRVIDEADGWYAIDFADARSEQRVTRRQRYTVERTEQAVTVTYGLTDDQGRPLPRQPAMPRHLRNAPHYRQMEHRGGRRPLR